MMKVSGDHTKNQMMKMSGVPKVGQRYRMLGKAYTN